MATPKHTCTFPGCERPHYARQLCKTHYNRAVDGKPLHEITARSVPTEARFWAKVNKTPGCWEWTASRSQNGYGRFNSGKSSSQAHRFSYELHHGPIPAGMVIDHICHVKACVRPDHLRLATNRENVEYRRGPARSNKSSGIRNVYPNGSGWQVYLKSSGETFHFGTYRTIEEAEQVAIRARSQMFTFPEIGANRVVQAA